jgi:hypothetical protein
MKKKLATILAVALTFAGLTFAAAPAAQAAGYGCDGTQIDSYAVKTSTGTTYGYLYLYYSSANGGTNCAVTVDTYFGSGVKKWMEVNIYRCVAGKKAGQRCDIIDTFDGSNSDFGNYYSYAGPRSVTGTASRCIMVEGRIDNPSGTNSAFARTLATHCG